MITESFFNPQTIAVVGASKTPGKVGHAVFANLVQGGFKGRLVPVNPSGGDLMGFECVKDLGDFEGTVDLGVIVVPTHLVKEAVSSSLKAGAKAIVVITAGFKESGAEGAALEKEIADLCVSRGARLMGPNCVGIINTEHLINASFATGMMAQGGISVISQSGAICTTVLDWAEGRHLGLAKLISLGNKADLDENDFLEALADDEQTKVILGYLTSIKSGDKFIRVTESVSAKKPVVILRAGTSESGSRAAASHTGALAGGDISYRAAFKRAGVIRADTFEALLDYSKAFAMQPIPQGDRVAIITNAGGPGIMAADAVENAGMHVAVINKSTAASLKAKLPAAASVGNPIDVLGDADPDRYVMVLDAAQEDDSVDAIIILLAPQAMTSPAEVARAIAQALRGNKPVLASFMGGKEVMPGRDELAAFNLPDYPSPERAVAALKAMVDYNSWLVRPPRIVTRFPVNRHRVERIMGRYRRIRSKQISEVDAKEILRAYDFAVPAGRLATNLEQAIDIAEHAGYPVAIKIVSPDIVHKSDIGGVKLGLSNEDQLADAFDLMMLRIKRKAPDAGIKGVYVEKMVDRGLETIIGMSRDPHFGPMLMFGLGGVFVEVMKDVAFHLAPITADEALKMLEGTKSYDMLRGARGQKKVDPLAIASGLQRISQLVTDFPQIEELDINPFIVGPIGTEPMVADARITLGEAGKEDD